MSKIRLEDIQWMGNSKKMYDDIMTALPLLYRAAVKKKFEVLVNQNQKKAIHEIDIKEAIEEYAPEKYKKMLMPIYEQYQSES